MDLKLTSDGVLVLTRLEDDGTKLIIVCESVVFKWLIRLYIIVAVHCLRPFALAVSISCRCESRNCSRLEFDLEVRTGKVFTIDNSKLEPYGCACYVRRVLGCCLEMFKHQRDLGANLPAHDPVACFLRRHRPIPQEG